MKDEHELENFLTWKCTAYLKIAEFDNSQDNKTHIAPQWSVESDRRCDMTHKTAEKHNPLGIAET